MGGGETDPGPLPPVDPLDVWLAEHGLAGAAAEASHTPEMGGHPAPVGVLTMLGEYVAEKEGVLMVGGWIVALGGAIWEGFHAGVYLRELFDAPSAREARRDAWRHYMRHNFWVSYPPLSNTLREAAFDRLAGDNASHGVVPLMTREALFATRELEDQISDRWLGHLCVIKALEEYIEKGPHTGGVTIPDHPDAPPDGGYAIILSSTSNEQQALEAARAQIEAEKKAMTEEMKTLVDFETDPANWALTPEQQALLPADKQDHR